ncbi:uncharacterized protein TNCV_4746481 [Trichonephila clavipes]|nr:uncharacterized protein TNCV_4746481 [Trichonephila clavipes]
MFVQERSHYRRGGLMGWAGIILGRYSDHHIIRKAIQQEKESPDHRDENCRLVDAPCCWPGKSFGVCRYKLLVAVDTRRYPRAENRVEPRKDHEESGSKDRAASTCGPHSDSFNDTSRRRRSNCSINSFQTPCRSKS